MESGQRFYSGGYLLIQGTSTEKRNNQLLPKFVFSSSECICDIYPLYWSLPKVKLTSDEEKNIRETYMLSEIEYLEILDYVEKLLDTKKMGWPYVFYEIDEAKKFYHKYLNHMNDIKLLGISLEEQYVIQFLHEEKAFSETSGIYEKLSYFDLERSSGGEIGYDILGFEISSFHSFICNGLEKAYKELDITVNEIGIISDYNQAVKAVNYTMSDCVGAEPVTWLPWRIIEYSLNE